MPLVRQKGKVPISPTNRYLSDGAAGLQLISKIISGNTSETGSRYPEASAQLRNLLSKCKSIRVEQEIDVSRKFDMIRDCLDTPGKYELLGKKTVVGVGGQFSSGKSLFLNRLLMGSLKDELPTDQKPSTSVPTYIVSGNSYGIKAYSSAGKAIPLDSEALGAISHQFQEQHHIGLAEYLSFIAIQIPDFPWKSLVLLDTPGYTKYDNKAESFTDKYKAASQLQKVDFLIWLINADNGTLRNDDIDFLKRLRMHNPILFVLNQCDRLPSSDYLNIRNEVRRAAQSADLQIFDVVCHSSAYPETINANDAIYRYLNFASQSGSSVEDLAEQFRSLTAQIDSTFTDTHSNLTSQKTKLGNAISRTTNMKEIVSLVQMYCETSSALRLLDQDHTSFQKGADKVGDALEKMQSASSLPKISAAESAQGSKYRATPDAFRNETICSSGSVPASKAKTKTPAAKTDSQTPAQDKKSSGTNYWIRPSGSAPASKAETKTPADRTDPQTTAQDKKSSGTGYWIRPSGSAPASKAETKTPAAKTNPQTPAQGNKAVGTNYWIRPSGSAPASKAETKAPAGRTGSQTPAQGNISRLLQLLDADLRQRSGK